MRVVDDAASPCDSREVFDLDSMQIAADGIAAEVNWRLAPSRHDCVALLAQHVVEDVAAAGLDAAIDGLRFRRASDPLVIDALIAVLLGEDVPAPKRADRLTV